MSELKNPCCSLVTCLIKIVAFNATIFMCHVTKLIHFAGFVSYVVIPDVFWASEG